MRVLNVRNVNDAFYKGILFLYENGDRRESRNGPVIQAPWPVSTVYEKPLERVLFSPVRDANPFFHLYESLWMIAGRNDVAPLERYVKNSINYSDDGKTLHGAYGFRWRNWFADWSQPTSRETGQNAKLDQLELIAIELKETPDSRRCVLQMWDGQYDLGRSGKDLPCNTIATFQRDKDGKLNLVVFCRSNDLVWGAFGANAVQFSTLLEYMAVWIDCPVGTYTQISVNFHGYEKTLLPFDYRWIKSANNTIDPYVSGKVKSIPMPTEIEFLDRNIQLLLQDVDGNFQSSDSSYIHPWSHMVYLVLIAHHLYKTTKGPDRYGKALEILSMGDQQADWIIAAREWILRRELKHSNENNL